ncbi:hypothetical protein FCL43_023430 [Enterobacter hormaechei]|uniref:hypothetical protein n=1 Tax=Enterobacter cloacae complex TaxID=354276 RepID=UPI000AD94124|nr:MULTISPECIES: hypothetical protein [Enterobacter cloacae complex]EMB8464683.1 hypothetical protein [Enterobacter hormaechei]EMB8469180.1 hypothetical protein [Enterobacter hormaechei]MCE1232670.1 hypothetical protein [Enterobacter hormaechei]MCE1335981.1 hypothetical protein [Enterobacter hormaechei]MCQ9485111.1 hypothetical protein [Enterobacter cloacae]
MTPEQFRQWFATLPEKYQRVVRFMYDDARKTGTHTASSLLLIRTLIEDQINFDGDFTL